MTENERYRKIGLGLQKKYSKEDLAYHFINCNVDDPVELGKSANDEGNMWGNMLKNAYWAPMGMKKT